MVNRDSRQQAVDMAVVEVAEEGGGIPSWRDLKFAEDALKSFSVSAINQLQD